MMMLMIVLMIVLMIMMMMIDSCVCMYAAASQTVKCQTQMSRTLGTRKQMEWVACTMLAVLCQCNTRVCTGHSKG